MSERKNIGENCQDPENQTLLLIYNICVYTRGATMKLGA